MRNHSTIPNDKWTPGFDGYLSTSYKFKPCHVKAMWNACGHMSLGLLAEIRLLPNTVQHSEQCEHNGQMLSIKLRFGLLSCRMGKPANIRQKNFLDSWQTISVPMLTINDSPKHFIIEEYPQKTPIFYGKSSAIYGKTKAEGGVLSLIWVCQIIQIITVVTVGGSARWLSIIIKS